MADCAKRRVGDEYHCLACRTRWDVADPEPPACPRQVEQPRITLAHRLRALSKRLREVALDVPIQRSIMDDLDDMIEEVALLVADKPPSPPRPSNVASMSRYRSRCRRQGYLQRWLTC